MAKGRTPLTGDRYTAADFEAAKAEPVVLAPQRPVQWTAPAVRVAGPPRAGDAPVRRRGRDLPHAWSAAA